MQAIKAPTVSELVRADYRLADVFKKWGINYCCGGHQPLSNVCRLQGLDAAKVEHDMQQARQTVQLSITVSFDAWPVDFLSDYIMHVHHAYVKTVASQLEPSFGSFVQSHQKKYPSLITVHGLFKKLVALLRTQIQYEEDVLFPYIKQVHNAFRRNESYGHLFVRTLHKSLNEATGKEQRQIQLALIELRQATQAYHFPAEACTNYQVFYHKLNEFDADLVQHKHLEHNILFPKVVQLEQALLHG